MMLTIHGLPPKIKFQDVKSMIRQECNINDFILDNLVADENGCKKIRVGLADGDEGHIVMKSLDRFRLPGNFVLTVVPIGKPAPAATQNTFESRPDFQNSSRSDFQGNQTRGNYPGSKQQPDHHSNPSREYPGNKPRNDYPGNQGRCDFQGNKSRSEIVGDFHDSKPREGGNKIANLSRDYQGVKPRGEFQGNQVRSDYHGNQSRDFQGPTRSDYQGPPRDDFSGSKSREFQGNCPREYPGNHSREYQGNYSNQGPTGSNLDRPSPWGANASGSGNQWVPPTSGQTQGQQTTFGYQQPGHVVQPFVQQPVPPNRAEVRPLPTRVAPQESQQPGFGFQAKNNDIHRLGSHEGRSHVLRSVEITDTPVNPPAQQGRYPPNIPYQPDKPVTIMKDNFQGPCQYSMGSGNQPGQYQGQGQAAGSAWAPTGQPTKPFAKSSPLQYEKPYLDERKYPNDRPMTKVAEAARITDNYPEKGRFSPKTESRRRRHSPDRHFSPSGRRLSPAARRMSPPGRDIIPAGRRMSPSGRDITAGRRMSPPARDILLGSRMSPSGRNIPAGRRMSPSGRDIPVGRRMSPSGRDMPVGRRMSPSGRDIPVGRRMSPSGRDLPTGRRMSPSSRDIPAGRRMSPSGRDMLAGRRMSPSNRDIPAGRRISPSGRDMPAGRHVARISPGRNNAPGRQLSPDGRRMSPGRRRISPSRRLVSPVGVRMSPGRIGAKGGREVPAGGRRMSPPGRRMSPIASRRQLVSPPRRLESRGSPPHINQRYSPGRHADKQPDKYGDSSKTKQVRPAYEPPSQAAQSMYSGGYRGGHEAGPYPRERDSWHRVREEREEMRRPHPSPHKSRSPVRFKSHSPSPRSPHSPRRSWALEKRGSPTIPAPRRGSPAAPPPPLWPSSVDARDKAARQPVWDRPDKPRHEDRYDDRPHRRPSRDPELQNFDRDRRPDVPQNQKDDRGDFREFRDERRHEELKLPMREEIDRDFDSIYKKALEFKKRAEELRSKSGERRRDYQEDRRAQRESSPRGERPVREERRHDWRRIEPEPKRLAMNPPQTLRDKAVDEIATKILVKHADCDALTTEQKLRLKEELKLAISRRVTEIFGGKEVTFIEIIIKYQGRYDERDEQNLLQDVMASLPSQYRATKRPAPESSAVPAKTSRWSADTEPKQDGTNKLANESLHWTVNIDPPKLVSLPLMPIAQLQQMHQFPQLQQPIMVPGPYMSMQQNVYHMPEPPQTQPQSETADDGYNLFLCKDDFDPFTENHAEYLKDYLISQIIKVTETSQGWAPDLTLKGLQSQLRYEVSTRDDDSREWLQKLDFSELENTHIFSGILVYTKEELWYERAAVWLPGHSRSRNIEPLEKLKLQNRNLTDVNVGKWKFVRKIVLSKGTRLYVDMPPSCARALEKHKMLLSFELQKVNVFLKAVAVDKDSFDAGLKEFSISDPSELIKAIQNSPVPSLPYEPTVIKITLKGCKNMTIVQARKIKEIIVYHLFKYHQQGGKSKTDFLKYGYVSPSYFGLVPENSETKRWILSQHLGKMNRHPIVILGGDDEHTRYFRMVSSQIPFANLPESHHPSVVMERLKHSNQGIKGINFNLWNPLKLVISPDRYKCNLEVDVDLESVETLAKMKFQLDYDMKHRHATKLVTFRAIKYSEKELKTKIIEYKAEMTDKYDNANMDLESSDDDLICLD